MRTQFVLHEVWIGLRRNLTMTIAVIATVAISLSLFGTGLLIRTQVDAMKGYWSDRAQVSVFLCVKSSPNTDCRGQVPVSAQTKDSIKSKLQGMPQVQKVYYESQHAAYRRFKEQFKNTPAFVQATDANALPDSFRVKLKNSNQSKPVVDAVQNTKGVDLVTGQDQALDRFLRVLSGLKWAALFIALLQIAAAALLIGNTIRLSAYNRRKETSIMRLVGSSNLYIQLPFLLEGAVAGLVGGGIASGLLWIAKGQIFTRLQHYVNSTAALQTSQVVGVIVLSVVVGVALCVIASFITLRRYMRV